MLHNIQELYGDIISASDGDIGHVKDFYFDDKSWVIRYLVADSGKWLNPRQVLLSPHAFGRWDREKDILSIHLTRKQIEDSPPSDAHRPVSRQYEQDYYRHYGWQPYWEGGGMWGVAGFPMVDSSPAKKPHPQHGHNQRDDLHLRSTKAVSGYEIQATDGAIGSVRSFLVDDKTWAIGDLVVETGHWFSGKEIFVRSDKVARIDYAGAKVFVNLSKAEIQQTADHGVVPMVPEL